MISNCAQCKMGLHDQCKYENCPCQHKATVKLPDGKIASATDEYLAVAQRLTDEKGKVLE